MISTIPGTLLWKSDIIKSLSHVINFSCYQFALDICGEKIFLAQLFDEMNDSEYYDEISDWKIREYEEQVEIIANRIADLNAINSVDAVNLKVGGYWCLLEFWKIDEYLIVLFRWLSQVDLAGL